MKKNHELTEIVRNLLVKYPSTRGNDNELIYRYLKKMGKPTDYEFLRTYNVNVAESIRRTRQKIQAQNPMLLPKPGTQRKRKSLEAEIREAMRSV